MNIKDFSQPTILSGKQYGTTVTIELDHSDTSIDEVMDGMLTIVKGLGYLEGTINEWIKDKSKDIYEDEYDIISKSLADDWFDEMDEEELPTECWCGDRDRCDCISQPNDNDEYSDDTIDWNENQPKPHYDWDEPTTNERIDIIGQNGNEGTHYGLATDEDIEECELNDRPHFEWGDEPEEDYEGQFQDWEKETPPLEDDEAEFNDYGMRIVPNDKLKAAAQRYSEEVRSKHTPIKEQKVLGKWQTDNKTKKIVTMDKTKVRKGKIKDLKK